MKARPTYPITHPIRTLLVTCALAAPAFTATAHAEQLFVGDSLDGSVGEYDASTGATINSSLITDQDQVYGLALSGEYLFDTTYSMIGEFTSTGNSVNPTLISELNYPSGIAVSGSNIFITNSHAGTVGEYTTSGGVVNAALIAGLAGPNAIAVAGGNLYVLLGETGSVAEYTESGTLVNANLITGLKLPMGMAISGSTIFVTNSGNGTIGAYSTSGTAINSSLVSGLTSPQAIAVSGQNIYVVEMQPSGWGSIAVYTTSGTLVNAALTPYLLRSPTCIAAGSVLSVTTQPLPVTEAAGGTIDLMVAATAPNQPTYQWQFNGTPIPGATGPTLTLADVGTAQNGAYSAVVTDGPASLTSATATLTVNTNEAPYTFTNLDDPAFGAGNTYPYGISGNNIVGYYSANSFYQGFIYNGSTYTTLPTTGGFGDGYLATGVSGNYVVGWGGSSAFLFNTVTQAYTTLVYPSATGTIANGISGSAIVGTYTDAKDSSHGFLYDTTTQVYTSLDDPNAVDGTANYGTMASGVSNGYIVGYYDDSSRFEHGFLFNIVSGSYTTLDYPNGLNTSASAISGDIVAGTYYDLNNTTHGFIYHISTGTFLNFDDPSGETEVTGVDGNNIVGFYSNDLGANAATHGFLATPASTSPTPVILTQPVDEVAISGGSANFSAVASSTPVPSYQWQLSADGGATWTNLTDGEGTSGSVTGQLTIANLGPALSGSQVRLVATNGSGSTASNAATLTVYPYAFQTLDDPEAAAGTGYGTFASGIDGSNIVGYYRDGNGVYHGFLYNVSTKAYTTIDAPNSGNDGTRALGISGSDIVGSYYDVGGNLHGFLYDGSTYTTLDDPSEQYGTEAAGISGNTIVGNYYFGYIGSGFLYNISTKTFTSIADPNLFSGFAGDGTFANGISGGTIVGWHQGAINPGGGTVMAYTIAGFVYDGTSFTDFEDRAGYDTEATGVSSGGIVGYYASGAGDDPPNHGFFLNNGAYSPLDDPLAGSGGTKALGISGSSIVGYFTDSNGSAHGFLATPELGPIISAQPVGQAVNSGSGVILTVVASGSSSLGYQWEYNGAPISGATGPTYSLSNVQAADAGAYWVNVSDSAGHVTQSNTATLTVNSASTPGIAIQPVSQSIATGSTVVFTVAAGGTVGSSLTKPGGEMGSLSSSTTYQWMFDGVALVDGGAISGSTGPQLVITGATPADDGDYSCLVTTSSGAVQSDTASLDVGTSQTPGYLVNISSRAFVGTGDGILIGGFFVGGSTSRSVLIQALGPALVSQGVSGVLQHPALTIHNSSGAVIYSNTGWGSNPVLLKAAAAAYAQPVLQANSGDSEALLTLPPGGYTAEIAGADGGTGVALCAIYQLP